MLELKIDAAGIRAREIGEDVPTRSQNLFRGAVSKLAGVQNPQSWTFNPWKGHIFRSKKVVSSLDFNERLRIISRFERGGKVEVRG